MHGTGSLTIHEKAILGFEWLDLVVRAQKQ